MLAYKPELRAACFGIVDYARRLQHQIPTSYEVVSKNPRLAGGSLAKIIENARLGQWLVA